MSEYDKCARGPLKLRIDDGIKKKKKKKSKQNDKKLLDHLHKSVDVTEVKPKSDNKLTKAELAFLKQQESIQKERILKKATMTHKQRVEEFNRHLDNLTEHFDIPKVSWTK